MSDKIFNIGVIFFVTIFLARYLGPEKFGILSYSISVISIFSIAGHAGLSGLVVREIVQKPSIEDETMGTCFLIKGIGFVAGAILVLIFAYFTEEHGSTEFFIIATLAIGLLFQPLDVIDFWFQSQLKSKYTSISRMIGLLFSSVIKLILVVSSAKLTLFALAHITQAIVTAIFLVVFYHYRLNFSVWDWKASTNRAKELLTQSWMIFLGSIFAIIYLRIDQIMLKWMSGNEAVGIYSVAATLSEAWYFIPAAIVASFFPKLINLKVTDPALYTKRLQQLFDFMFILALFVAIIMTSFAPSIINITFGSSYINSSDILIVHIWAALFIFMRAVFSKWILIENVLMFSLLTQGMGAIINIALNFILIPEYGGLGAAYATLLSYATSSYFALMFYKKTRPVFWMMSLAITSPIRLLISIGSYK